MIAQTFSVDALPASKLLLSRPLLLQLRPLVPFGRRAPQCNHQCSVEMLDLGGTEASDEPSQLRLLQADKLVAVHAAIVSKPLIPPDIDLRCEPMAR